ncbi:hypothetical protein J1N35_042727 [Gossypium stocksii]|uniref:Uncharacterized protein n=1 Tax=Gossypium stocksii TaxID=47602 RepID=A0A9D3U631_9ROSI|nr:hypothetical protein J1N35_042727 [Gossypium stocksii]
MNAKLLKENTYLKKENAKLIKKVKAKGSLLTGELINLKKTQRKLSETKPKLKKFNFDSEKLDEVLATRSRDPGKEGFGYMDKEKVVMKSPTVFVKATNCVDLGK